MPTSDEKLPGMTSLQVPLSLSELQCQFKDGDIAVSALVLRGEVNTRNLGHTSQHELAQSRVPLFLVLRQRSHPEPSFTRVAYQCDLTTPDGQSYVNVELALGLVEFTGIVNLLKSNPERFFVVAAQRVDSFVWQGVEIIAVEERDC